jgi:hypothetical protein
LPYIRIIRLTLGKHKWISTRALEQSINASSHEGKVPEPFNESILRGQRKLRGAVIDGLPGRICEYLPLNTLYYSQLQAIQPVHHTAVRLRSYQNPTNLSAYTIGGPPQSSRVRFPVLPDSLRSSGSGTGNTQPRQYNSGAN